MIEEVRYLPEEVENIKRSQVQTHSPSSMKGGMDQSGHVNS